MSLLMRLRLSLCVCVSVCAWLCTVGRQVLMDRDRLLSGRSHAVDDVLVDGIMAAML